MVAAHDLAASDREHVEYRERRNPHRRADEIVPFMRTPFVRPCSVPLASPVSRRQTLARRAAEYGDSEARLQQTGGAHLDLPLLL